MAELQDSGNGEESDELDTLAHLAAGGDADALDDLLGMVQAQGLARVPISRLLVDADDIDDVEQDALIALARSIENFRGEARFTTWLWTVSRRCAIAHLRRSKPTNELNDLDLDLGEVQRISSRIATRTSIEDVLSIIPAKYARPVYLRDVQDHSYDDIASELGLSLGTVKSRIARGRALAAASLRDAR